MYEEYIIIKFINWKTIGWNTWLALIIINWFDVINKDKND